jgi:rhamnosyltransferase
MRHMRWVRLYPGPEQREAIECANLNGSGTLVPVAVWNAPGGMDEALFIDHVDTDWSFRMRSLGYRLHGVPRAAFVHRMGDASRRVWLFGWRVWPLRSPQRHFFLYRNSVRLMRRPYVPVLWKVWAVAKLGLTLVITPFVDERPLEQLRQMAKGLRAGFAA